MTAIRLLLIFKNIFVSIATKMDQKQELHAQLASGQDALDYVREMSKDHPDSRKGNNRRFQLQRANRKDGKTALKQITLDDQQVHDHHKRKHSASLKQLEMRAKLLARTFARLG